MSLFSERMLFAFAIIANCLVIVICFGVLGWDEEGAGSAARNTARLASVFFLVGFAARGLRRWLSGLPESTVLIQAFVAAQMVHFGAVILLHSFRSQEFMSLRGTQIVLSGVLVLVGFTLVVATGMTADPRPNLRLYSMAHIVLLHVIFLIYAVDYAMHPVRPLRWMVVPVALALAMRYWPQRAVTARAAGMQ